MKVLDSNPGAANGPGAPDYFGNVRTEIAEHLLPVIGDLLEIGCGRGMTIQWVKRQAKVNFCAGVEIHGPSGSLARQHFDEVEICSVEECQSLVQQERFDTVLALDVLEHLPRPDLQLQRIRRCIRNEGLLVVSIPNSANFCVSWPLFFLGQWRYADEGHLDRTHLRFFDAQTAADLLTSAGFRILKTTHTVKCPNLFGWLGWRTKRARWYSRRLFQWLAPKHMWISQFVISATPVGREIQA